MREYLVKCAFPDLIHPPAMIYAAYVVVANNDNHAAHRAEKLVLPAIEAMLRKVRVNPYTIGYVAEELLTIMSIELTEG